MGNSRQKRCNVNVSLYEGEFVVCFDCQGNCAFALGERMDAGGLANCECTFNAYGACRNPNAQVEALKSIVSRLKKQLKELEEGLE